MSEWRALAAIALSDPDPTAKIAELPKRLQPAAEDANCGNLGKSGNDPDGELEERAAIIADGSQAPLEWAAGFAQLCLRPTPAGVNPAEWAAVLNGAGKFLDQRAGVAHRLGWTAEELFGLEVAQPLRRFDRRGAAFFLARAEVVAVTADDITIRAAGGSIQRLSRKPASTPPNRIEMSERGLN